MKFHATLILILISTITQILHLVTLRPVAKVATGFKNQWKRQILKNKDDVEAMLKQSGIPFYTLNHPAYYNDLEDQGRWEWHFD